MRDDFPTQTSPTSDGPAEGMPFAWMGRTALQLEAEGGRIVAELASAANVNADDVLSGSYALQPEAYLLLCALVINAADDEMHGVARGRMERGTANLLVQAMSAAVDLEGAIRTAERFFKLVGSYCRIRLEVVGNAAAIALDVGGEQHTKAVVEEMLATFLHSQLSSAVGFLLPLRSFRTTACRHPFVDAEHPYFLCNVLCSPVTSLVFQADLLAVPVKKKMTETPLLSGELDWIGWHLDRRDHRFSDAEADSLKGSLFRLLEQRELAYEACCDVLGRSERELRRGLAMEGTTFRQVRRLAIISRASFNLRGGCRTDDLASIMGYADARSLRRGIKLASGLSLRELRSYQVNRGSWMLCPIVARLREETFEQVG